VQFDDQYEVNFTAKPVKDAPLLDRASYVPRGATALLDAIGRTMIATGARLSAMVEHERPSKVLFVIQTDGYENASREWDKARISALIKQQTEIYKWNFVYLGANQDAIAVAADLGVAQSSSMTFAANEAGTQAASASVSNYVRSYRVTGQALFTDEDRKKQAEASVKTPK
jgi:hypothetical protein